MPTRQNEIVKPESDVIDRARYPLEVFYSEEDGGFIATAKDLPGCSAFGKTHAKAVTEIQHAIKAWQDAASAAGNPVPEPSSHGDEVPLPSGKVLLRIPRSLHASLIEQAKKESVSLNQHLVSVLSLSVGASLLQERQGVAAFSWWTFTSTNSGVAVLPPVSSTEFKIVEGHYLKQVTGTTQPFDVRTSADGLLVWEGR
jgi:predicted RNase H-like HicB family nuclease